MRATILFLLVPFASIAAAQDRDGDGLSDFQEIHKYRTNPDARDSDGDGRPDGEWEERREYTYSIRTVIRVMRPVNEAALNDDYQDARVRERADGFVELEVVHYPLNTNADAIEANATWKKDYAGMDELKPGVTTDWDKSLRREILRELGRAGIDPDRLTDKEVVERVSRWALSRARARDMFCTYYVHFPKGRPKVLPGTEDAFLKDRGDQKWSTREQFRHELLGKEMFRNRSRGTCTSTAIYLTTVLRAVGIPTRMVVGVPAVDASDDAQVAMLQENLTHHGARAKIVPTLRRSGGSFAAHTYNEVYVGNRWRRLNYQRLGANTMDPHCFGLMTHVHRFPDLSEAGLAETWGLRYAKGQRDEAFPGANPYTALEVSDLFGPHARIDNPEVKIEEHGHLTISRAYWWKERPDWITKKLPKAQWDEHVLVHVDEWIDSRDYSQIKEFMQRASVSFVLRAKGHPDLTAENTKWYFTWPQGDGREILLRVGGGDMARGVDYTLVPQQEGREYVWQVKAGLTLRRE